MVLPQPAVREGQEGVSGHLPAAWSPPRGARAGPFHKQGARSAPWGGHLHSRLPAGEAGRGGSPCWDDPRGTFSLLVTQKWGESWGAGFTIAAPPAHGGATEASFCLGPSGPSVTGRGTNR